jgi:hypothetical protein
LNRREQVTDAGGVLQLSFTYQVRVDQDSLQIET